jgi:tRNA-modifying protein YgfZ
MPTATVITAPPLELQHLPERALIGLAGEGVLSFLQNLLTCDVSHLAVGEAAYGALLSPQGKILHDVFVYHDEFRVLLDCAASQRDELIQKLKLYRLRAKFEIKPVDTHDVGIGSVADQLSYRDPRYTAFCYRMITPKSALPQGKTYHAARIAAGLADSDADLGVGQTFPHEANFDQFGGVNFKKGCYVGQEVVSRMQHRSTARNRIVPVHLSAATDARDVMADNVIIGSLLSRVDLKALAMLRLDRLADVTAPLTAGHASLTVVLPAWWQKDILVAGAA